MRDSIFIKGARENNLKNIDLEIPRDKLVVFTGLSGSGKSSLAFDTIYAEGQRRYVESLSSYARMFLGQMDKPDVDYIEGLSRSPEPLTSTTTVRRRSSPARTGVSICPRSSHITSASSAETASAARIFTSMVPPPCHTMRGRVCPVPQAKKPVKP